TRRELLVDTAPLGPAYRDRPRIGSLEELRAICGRLLEAGVVDSVRDIDYEPATRERVYARHFDGPVSHTHNFRGYPVLGSMEAIEDAAEDYLVHFDSDMLLHQDPGVPWIDEGIRLLESASEVAAVCPRAGPPAPGGALLQCDEV